jgi:hypothetical protein
MQGGRAMLAQGFEVFGGGIAFVLRQSVLRVDGIPVLHAGIAMGFSENGSRGNRDATAIAFDKRLLLDEDVQLDRVNQKIIGRDRQLLQRGSHGLTAGLVNVPGVNALGVDFSHRPRESVLSDALRKNAATLLRELFGVIEADYTSLGIEDDRAGDNWAEQRATSGFVEPGDARPPQFARRALETGRAEAAHFAKILARGIALGAKQKTQPVKLLGHDDAERCVR